MKKLSVTCQKCRRCVTLYEDHQQFPMFSKEGAFNHGVARPEYLKGLSHVELALFSPDPVGHDCKKSETGCALFERTCCVC